MDKVTLKPVELFEITIGDIELGRFSIESKWERMVKLRNVIGQVLIVSDKSSFIDTLFFDYFRDKDSFDASKDFDIVSASPDLLQYIADEKDGHSK